MPLWLQTALWVLGLISVVPLFVLANTGRWGSAWYALKRYLLYLGMLALPAAVLGIGYIFTLAY